MRGWGTVASLIWAVAVAAYAIGYVTTLSPTGGEFFLAVVGFLAAALVPLGLIFWVGRLSDELSARDDTGAALSQEINALKAEVERLSGRVADAEKAAKAAAALPAPVPAPAAPVTVEPTPAGPEPDPAPAPDPAPSDDQPSLPLEGGSDAGPLTLGDTIMALNFPRDPQDSAGFAVLRRALESHDLAKLLQASEDCLNLLAHEGIYTDDLIPAPATAREWRQFARGGAARAELMPLNGITDQSALETVRDQMRKDPIFRDTALYFQRRFDRMLQDAAPDATDAELLQLVDTRSGRAFVLLVQVAGLNTAGG